MSLETGKKIRRRNWTELPINDRVIARVHELANKKTDDNFKYSFAPGVLVEDDPQIPKSIQLNNSPDPDSSLTDDNDTSDSDSSNDKSEESEDESNDADVMMMKMQTVKMQAKMIWMAIKKMKVYKTS